MEREPSIVDRIFERIYEELPNLSFLHGKQVFIPILFIDEVNLMQDLVINDSNDQNIVKSILHGLY